MSTEIIGLDEIIASQSAKEITHNTGLRQLEGRIIRVKSKTIASQPTGNNGDTYILPAGGTGFNWSGYSANQIAHYYGGSWKAWTPVEGVRVWVNDEDATYVYDGAAWVLYNRPLPVRGVSADNGDAAASLTVAAFVSTQIWNTPITADRAVTLSTTGAKSGDRFRIVRTAAATGAFNLNVGTGPLKAMGTAGSFCDVEYNGTAWLLTAYGTL